MSDLAPFVAATLRDRTFDALIQENNELRLKLKESEDAQLRVQITGPKRSPVHYESSLKDGKSSIPTGRSWALVTEIVLPFHLLWGLEIWLGDNRITSLMEMYPVTTNIEDPTLPYYHDGMVRHSFHSAPASLRGMPPNNFGMLDIPIWIGPFEANPHTRRFPDGSVTELISFYEQNDTVPRDITIDRIMFKKESIPGCISLLNNPNASRPDNM